MKKKTLQKREKKLKRIDFSIDFSLDFSIQFSFQFLLRFFKTRQQTII